MRASLTSPGSRQHCGIPRYILLPSFRAEECYVGTPCIYSVPCCTCSNSFEITLSSVGIFLTGYTASHPERPYFSLLAQAELPASDLKGQGSITSVWGLWWTNWQRDRFISECLRYSNRPDRHISRVIMLIMCPVGGLFSI